MNPSLASLVYACGIAGLFYLDRDKSIRTSKALWLPVLYLWIIGSRPVSAWLGITPADGTNTQLEGSPVDAAFFGILLIASICVLVRRGRRTLTFLNESFPMLILIYFVFCLLSVCWSDYPFPAFKKWIKAVGDLAMILIVLTDEQPIAALRRLFSRTGFILMPISLLFIKYYPNLGKTYDPWTGAQMATGLTLDKNMLGVITFVLLLGTLWRVLALLRSDEMSPHRRRHLLAQGTLLVIGINLLTYANSVTSSVSFVLGAGLILTTRLKFMRRNPAAVHVLVVLLIVAAGSVSLLGRASVAHALGRNPSLTGRTEIWAAVISMAPNPLVGAGFESFWLSPSVHGRLWQLWPGLPLNEAHNGYIELYLNLGWVGLGLTGLILIDGYRRSVKAFRRAPALGGLLLAYILAAITYSVSEAGFRMMHPNWIFFLLASVEASNIAAGVGVGARPPLDASSDRAPELPAGKAFAMRPTRRSMAGKSCDDKQPEVTRVHRSGDRGDRNGDPIS
jgi:exopolysaccharide production protein ExoQ